MSARLRSGSYEADLNPSLGLPISGYYQPKIATQFHDRLYAKAISLSSGDERVLMASLDLVGLAKRTCDEIRKEAEDRLKVPKENVVLLSTHTHSGPETFSSNASLSETPPEVPMRTELEENIGWMKRMITFALEQAMKDERPVDRTSVTSTPVKGMFSNRNDPARTIDRTLTTLRLGREKRPLFLVNHNCHPTVLGANNVFYSADFPAYLSRSLAEKLNAEQVNCVTGSCGDVSTRLTLGNEFSKRRNLANTVRYGETLADLVVASQRNAKTLEDSSLYVASRQLELKVKKHPDASESERLRLDLEKEIKRTREATRRSKLELALEGIKIWEETLAANPRGLPSTMGFDLGVVALGEEFALVWASGELLSETGLMLKQKSRFGTTMVSGYGNGDIGYIPLPQSYENLEYEAVVSPLEEGETKRVEGELLRLLV
ncbi:MAG: hypothetical protein OK474_00890 [Thaumarchaeota archaeon]|nr:hypothetical protein [Nitrososphaerota archaeon]